MKHDRIKEIKQRLAAAQGVETADPNWQEDLRECINEVIGLHVHLEFIAAGVAGAMMNGSREALMAAGDSALGRIQKANEGWRHPSAYGSAREA